MCFPGKRLKKTFSDDIESKPKPKPAAPAPAPAKSSPAAATSTPTKASAMSPKVAIVIYSMYGHIATRMSTVLFPRPGRPLTLYIQSLRA